jgi:hypothetical protein
MSILLFLYKKIIYVNYCVKFLSIFSSKMHKGACIFGICLLCFYEQDDLL